MGYIVNSSLDEMAVSLKEIANELKRFNDREEADDGKGFVQTIPIHSNAQNCGNGTGCVCGR